MPLAPIGGTELYFERSGAGEPILLLQGMSGTHAAWGAPFVAALRAAGLEVIVYDHRGVGRSKRWRAPFSIVDLAEDAAALLDALELAGAHVVGGSMGGMVAQELALRAPGRVCSLVLGATYAGGAGSVLADPADLEGMVAALQSGDSQQLLRASFELNVSAAFARTPGTFDAFRSMAAGVPVAQAVTALQLQAVGGHDAIARLAAIAAPTLVLHGDEDRMLPPANAATIASAVPGSTLVLLPGAGHLFWWEQPDRSARLVATHALSAHPKEPS